MEDFRIDAHHSLRVRAAYRGKYDAMLLFKGRALYQAFGASRYKAVSALVERLRAYPTNKNLDLAHKVATVLIEGEGAHMASGKRRVKKPAAKKATLRWVKHPGDRNQAPRLYTTNDSYTIVDRSKASHPLERGYNLLYRPEGEHVFIGSFKTLAEAKLVAETDRKNGYVALAAEKIRRNALASSGPGRLR